MKASGGELQALEAAGLREYPTLLLCAKSSSDGAR
jgi:hypothetical protein